VSLRWKIALALAAITSVATIAVGAANYRSTRDRLYAEIDRSLTAVDARVSERLVGSENAFPERGPLAGYEAQLIRSDGTVAQRTLGVPLPVTELDLGLVGQRGPAIGQPIPEAAFGNPVLPAPGGEVIVPEVDAAPMPISDCSCKVYERVCYKDRKHLSPCAEPMIVSVSTHARPVGP